MTDPGPGWASIIHTQVLTLQLLWLASCAFHGWIHVTICTSSDQLWCEIVFPPKHTQENKDSLDASQATKTKSEADPETSLNSYNNNAPKCLFPSLARNHRHEARNECFNAQKQNESVIWNKRRLKGIMFVFLFAERVSEDKTTVRVEKLYCTTGKQLHSNSPQKTKTKKQKHLRAEEIFHG